MLATISATQVVLMRSQLRSRETARIEGALQSAVAAIEDRLLAELDTWLVDVEADPERAARLQDRWRRSEPWFDSVYVWERTPADPRRPGAVPAVRLLFPSPAIEDFPIEHACLAAADAARITLEVHEVARQYVLGCRDAPLHVRVAAATEGATLLAQAHDPREGLALLDASGVPPNLGLADGLYSGVAPWQVTNLRVLRSELLLRLGAVEEGLAADYALGVEITGLDAPDAEPLLARVRHPLLKQLRANGQRLEADRLEALLLRAERRVRAWQEIRDRLAPAPGGPAPGTRLTYDQYATEPWLLFSGWTPGGQRGVALQLEQRLLVEAVLDSEPLRAVRPYLTVTDASGHWVAGARRGGPLAVVVPFTRTLTHLRIGLRAEAVDATLAELQLQWVSPLLVVGLACVLGGAALWAQLRASRELDRLLARQRDFTTRVTHELKTPLAGIKVMGENLESGAWSDPEQVQRAAGRIVAEADRLTQRVDQVLAVARTRSIPNPEPFDPEEPVFAAVDAWGPRLEAAGVRLTADLHPTDRVLGDAEALRDAIACLLDNALKYRRADRPDSQVWLTLDQSGNRVEIRVTDNGLGVPAKQRQAIFERFVRVEGPNRGAAGGHGLGLAQVQEIARAHGGSATCTDGVDGGATFTLRLPVVR